jgi:hypothetical protein
LIDSKERLLFTTGIERNAIEEEEVEGTRNK